MTTPLLHEVAVAAEHALRDAATERWENGTGRVRALLGRPAHLVVAELAAQNDVRAKAGMTKWSGMLLEATATAYASDSPVTLRAAVLDAAALAVAWLHTLDTHDPDGQAVVDLDTARRVGGHPAGRARVVQSSDGGA